MKRTTIILVISMLLIAVALQAQAPAPKPGPEHKKMQLLAGNWTYEREDKTTPFGTQGKYMGKYSSREILNGFFVEYPYTVKGPQGDGQWMEIDGYDPVAKTNTYSWFGDSGGMGRGTFTVTGNNGTWEGTGVFAGVQYRERGSFSLSTDGTSYTKKGEMTIDGKTWIPWFEMKATKAKALSK